MKKFFSKWWNSLRYEPDDPRHRAGGEIKIVAIGGGTGLSTLLRGLKKYSNDITAIVAVTDDGASSGQLRKEFDILPPGDIRKCISALSYDEKLVSSLMEYRFAERKNSLSGHTLGNIWITALSDRLGSFARAVEATTEIFKTAGRVLPATLSKTELCAQYIDGKKIVGESKIPEYGKKIVKVFLKDKSTGAYSKSVKAILDADLVIFGPGSLYTSVIPNLLIYGIVQAIRKNSRSVNVYICNCSTERGETENYSVYDHIKAITDHIGGNAFDYCLVNNSILKKTKEGKLGGVKNITCKESEILGVKIAKANVVSRKRPLYHDPDKLAKAVIELYNKVKS